MERYKRVISSIFDDGIVNIGRIRVALMFTSYFFKTNPGRASDYCSAFYDVFMSVTDIDKIIRRIQQDTEIEQDGTLLPVSR